MILDNSLVWILFVTTVAGLFIKHLIAKYSDGKLTTKEVVQSVVETGAQVVEAQEVCKEVITELKNNPKSDEIIALIDKTIEDSSINNDATVEIIKSLIKKCKK